MLERTIDALLENNIREIVIVTGYLHEMLESFVQTRYPSLSVKFIHNELYATYIPCGWHYPKFNRKKKLFYLTATFYLIRS